MSVDVRWRPFMLDASISDEGIDRRSYYVGKFGGDAATAWSAQLRVAFAEEGLGAYRLDGLAAPSLHAHRLLAHAQTFSSAHAHMVADALFELYFCRTDENIADFDTLSSTVGNMGLAGLGDATNVRAFLESSQYEQEVSEAAVNAAAQGMSVPHFSITALAAGNHEHSGDSNTTDDVQNQRVQELSGVQSEHALLRAFGVVQSATSTGNGPAPVTRGGSAHGHQSQLLTASRWREQNLLPSMISASAPSEPFPASMPFVPSHFARLDEGDDTSFYSEPRLEQHLDEGARTALTAHYKGVFNCAAQRVSSASCIAAAGGTGTEVHAGLDVLDLCASWTSHFPDTEPDATADASRAWRFGRVHGCGMNASELAANARLTDWSLRDLNLQPTLPLPSDSFDVATCALSIDYLTRPLDIVREVFRVLRPGGCFVVSFSDRMFRSKATSLWRDSSVAERLWIVAAFFVYSGVVWRDLSVLDLSPADGDTGDPLFVVQAFKSRS